MEDVFYSSITQYIIIEIFTRFFFFFCSKCKNLHGELSSRLILMILVFQFCQKQRIYNYLIYKMFCYTVIRKIHFLSTNADIWKSFFVCVSEVLTFVVRFWVGKDFCLSFIKREEIMKEHYRHIHRQISITKQNVWRLRVWECNYL